MPKLNSKSISLALQGGGAYGAITWGVLDRILSDERLQIDSISATSAGSMNAVALADGFLRDGNEGARQALVRLWRSISALGRFSPLQRSIWDRLRGSFSLETSPSYGFFSGLTQLIPPQYLNPLNINPLRSLLAEQIDFDRVNSSSIKVFISATSVRTGQPHVFRQPDLSAAKVMASACVPFMFDAEEIDGELYWDGGYSGNPALFPLVDDQACRDLLVVQINPVVREQKPQSMREILNRIDEITFNSNLINELRTVQLLHQLIDADDLEQERSRDMRLHLLRADREVANWSGSSKYNSEWEYLSQLREHGWQLAEEWLEEHYEALGESSTFDVDALFQNAIRPIEHSQAYHNL